MSRVNGEEQGSAVVEFILLVFVLVIPLVYFVVAVFAVQNASFAAEGAARDAGRVLAASRDESLGRDAAHLSARMAFEDAAVAAPPAVTITCSEDPCVTGGGAIHVTVTAEVPLPLIPTGLVDALGATVRVEGTAVTMVDPWVVR